MLKTTLDATAGHGFCEFPSRQSLMLSTKARPLSSDLRPQSFDRRATICLSRRSKPANSSTIRVNRCPAVSN